MKNLRRICIDKGRSLARSMGFDIQRYHKPPEEHWREYLFRSLLPDNLFDTKRDSDVAADFVMF